MREIKFKLWCKNKNEWEKDLWWIGCDGNLYTVLRGQLRDIKKENHIPCQFTGLLDKNGKEIYEGDIVKTFWGKPEDRTEIIFETVFQAGCFTGKEIETNGFYYMEWPSEYFLGCEVVGNLYENPELLKED